MRYVFAFCNFKYADLLILFPPSVESANISIMRFSCFTAFELMISFQWASDLYGYHMIAIFFNLKTLLQCEEIISKWISNHTHCESSTSFVQRPVYRFKNNICLFCDSIKSEMCWKLYSCFLWIFFVVYAFGCRGLISECIHKNNVLG